MRRRLRKLRLGDRDFVWRADLGHVPGDGVDLHRCVNVRVWGAGKNSRALTVDLLSKAMSAGWTPAATDNSHPGPDDIRQLIEFALTLGWEPDAHGGTFPLTESSGVELPGFLITDRVRRPDAPDPTARVIRAYEQRSEELPR